MIHNNDNLITMTLFSYVKSELDKLGVTPDKIITVTGYNSMKCKHYHLTWKEFKEKSERGDFVNYIQIECKNCTLTGKKYSNGDIKTVSWK